MNASGAELFEALRAATLALSFAIVLVLLLRVPMRRGFGAGAAYAIWWLVPAALLALLLPPPTVEVAMVARPVSAAPVAAAASPAPVGDGSLPWLALWLMGAGALACLLWRQQRRFVQSLGRLRALGSGLWRAEGRNGLPAVVGALRPRIVLPEDFEARYAPLERALMIAHERAHVRRRDPLANLGMALLRVLFWFNPLVHAAAARFREDQELSCDQRVIAGTPQSRRAYGDAMLKTLVAAQPVPLGCHWGLAHPLKERLMQLKNKPPQRRRRIAGIVAALALSTGVAFAVWSAQTPRTVPIVATAETRTAGDFHAEIGLRLDEDAARRFAVEHAFGETFAFSQQQGQSRVDIEARVDSLGGKRYRIEADIRRDGQLVASPRLVTESGKAAVVRIGQASPDARFVGIELDITLRPPGDAGLPTPRPLARAVLDAPQLAALSADIGAAAVAPDMPMDSMPITSMPITSMPGQDDLAWVAPLPDMPGQPAPTQIMAGQHLPGQTIAGQPYPDQIAPLPGVPGQAALDQVMPARIMPGPSIPGQTIPGQSIPGQSIPSQPYPHAAAPALAPMPAIPGQAFPGQAVPGVPGAAGRGTAPVVAWGEMPPLARAPKASVPARSAKAAAAAGTTSPGPRLAMQPLPLVAGVPAAAPAPPAPTPRARPAPLPRTTPLAAPEAPPAPPLPPRAPLPPEMEDAADLTPPPPPPAPPAPPPPPSLRAP